ncbi:polysaccharide deacetylase family protein [Holdemania massiliensis]|uniref:polysaccharide deacetylase family protein n=1 Tax=Holdemania massiliensis TaxID=1468449 RepID=UPI001567ABBE|nr:polysaccharide deacetylase family protein [Holdemania massiliensis]
MKFAARKSSPRYPNRVPGVFLFLFIGGLLCLFGFWSLSIGQKPKKPSFLEAEDRQLDHALHQKQDDFEIVVFYPQEPQEIVSTAKQQAEQLMTSLSTKKTEMPELPAAKQESPEPTLIKADYHTEILEQNTLSVVYLIQKKVGDQIEEDHWGYILDLQTGELITADQAFDQTGLDRISALFRDAMKNQEATHDLAYTLSFITASAPAAENFSSFYLEEDQLTFFVDIAAESLSEISSNEEKNLKTTSAMEKELRWSVDPNQLGSHFLLKPGVEEENLFIPPRTVDPQRPMVALTFDDGPHPKNTPRILETLKTYDGASTFFMVGTNVERYPDVVLQVAENGSEIASHTYNHPNLTRLSADSLNVQLNRVSELVNDLTHQQIQIQTLRPPYGAVNEQVKEASPTPLILWSLDTLDWKTRSAEKTVDLVLSQVEDGDIILMHDIHAESADAAETLIPKLTEMGFQLVTVQELMEAKGLEMLPGQKIFSANQDK